MHDTLKYFATDPLFRAGHHNKLTFGLLYAYSERFVLPLSHDEVVHLKGSLYGRMPGLPEQKLQNLRSLFAWMWAHPGRKLLFMGGEFGQPGEWNHDRSLDWHLLAEPERAGVQDLIRTANRLYAARARPSPPGRRGRRLPLDPGRLGLGQRLRLPPRRPRGPDPGLHRQPRRPTLVGLPGGPSPRRGVDPGARYRRGAVRGPGAFRAARPHHRGGALGRISAVGPAGPSSPHGPVAGRAGIRALNLSRHDSVSTRRCSSSRQWSSRCRSSRPSAWGPSWATWWWAC